VKEDRQRALRLWVLAWLPLIPLLYLVVNAGGYWYRWMDLCDIGDVNFPTLITIECRSLLCSRTGILVWPVLSVVPYALWLTLKNTPRFLRWISLLLPVLFLVALVTVQWGFLAPMQREIYRSPDGLLGMQRFPPGMIRFVLIQSWKLHTPNEPLAELPRGRP